MSVAVLIARAWAAGIHFSRAAKRKARLDVRPRQDSIAKYRRKRRVEATGESEKNSGKGSLTAPGILVIVRGFRKNATSGVFNSNRVGIPASGITVLEESQVGRRGQPDRSR
jgi:hypothetical protein